MMMKLNKIFMYSVIEKGKKNADDSVENVLHGYDLQKECKNIWSYLNVRKRNKRLLVHL